jgi:hypothetical protein
MKNDDINSSPDSFNIRSHVKSAMIRKFDNLPDGTPDYEKGPVEVVKIEYNEDETIQSFNRYFFGDSQCR